MTLLIILLLVSPVYGSMEKVDEYVEKKKAEWTYNPFRQSNNEMFMVGRSDPRAFITRFWIGSMPTLKEAFPPSTGMHIDQIQVAMVPSIATEFSVIPFEIGRVKTRIGIAVKIEIQLFLFSQPVMPYGNNYVLSDTVTVTPYLDLIIDDRWKIRWLPLIHYCSHAGGDFLGDPETTHPLPGKHDTGTEHMGFELYYARSIFTVYGGLMFPITKGVYKSRFATEFLAFTGLDVRIPVWGQINYLISSHFGLEVNMMNDIDYIITDGLTELVTKRLNRITDYVVSIGTGLQIDRYTLLFRYLRQRSQHISMYQSYEERIGFEAGFYF